MDKRYAIIKYDSQVFNFKKVLQNLFGVKFPEFVHHGHKTYDEKFEVGKDSSTIYHKTFYDQYRSGWPAMEDMYENFIRDEVSLLFFEDFLYQRFPTFRVHLPNNIAVGDFHNDGDFHHPDGEVNFIIPITCSDLTQSVWVESKPGLKDFSPIKLEWGELVMFNGNKLTHGNKINLTSETRMSMDFRVLPVSKYTGEDTGGSMTLNTKFKEGEYYKRFTHGMAS